MTGKNKSHPAAPPLQKALRSNGTKSQKALIFQRHIHHSKSILAPIMTIIFLQKSLKTTTIIPPALTNLHSCSSSSSPSQHLCTDVEEQGSYIDQNIMNLPFKLSRRLAKLKSNSMCPDRFH